jgi:hypothetical protein
LRGSVAFYLDTRRKVLIDVMIHAKLHKPDRMSNQESFGVWKQEMGPAPGTSIGHYDVTAVIHQGGWS